MTDHISGSELEAALRTLRTSVTVPAEDPGRHAALMDTFDRGHHSGPVSSWASWATAAALVMVVVTLHVSTKRTHVTVEDAFTAATHEPSAFVSWPGAEQYPSFDSAALVRIHLSPQVVAELGLPVPQAASSDIPADVLVGQDGLARFVRLAASPSPTTDPRY